MNYLLLVVVFLFLPSMTFAQTSKLPPIKEYHFGENSNLSIEDAEFKFVHYKNGEWYKVPVINGIVPRFEHVKRKDGTVYKIKYHYDNKFETKNFWVRDEMPDFKPKIREKIPIELKPKNPVFERKMNFEIKLPADFNPLVRRKKIEPEKNSLKKPSSIKEPIKAIKLSY